MLKVVYKDSSVAQWISALESSLFCIRRKGSYFKDDLGYHKSAHLRLSIQNSFEEFVLRRQH